MEIKDLVGLSEPLTKLIDVVSKGCGKVAAPYLIRAKAKAEADRIRIVSEALREAAVKNNLPIVYKDGEIEMWKKPEDGTLTLEGSTIDQRVASRIDYQERRNQANIDSIASTAAIELASEATEISAQLPDEDWIARFFKSAEDVSSEQMQDLWGRILAGEIVRPRAYSLRTLDAVRQLSQSEAELFSEVGQLAIMCLGDAGDDGGVILDVQTVNGEPNFYSSLEANKHIRLSEIGLMYPDELTMALFSRVVEQEVFRYGDYVLEMRGEGASVINIGCRKFTDVGSDLLNLVPRPKNASCLIDLGVKVARAGGAATLREYNPSEPRSLGDVLQEFPS